MEQDFLLSLESNPSTKSLAPENYFQQYSKPSLVNLLRLLHLDKTYHKANDEFLYYKNSQEVECKVIDVLGGYGSVLLGHNLTILKEEMIKLSNDDVPVHAQLSIRHRAGLLAEKLNSIIRHEAPHHFAKPYIVHLTNSGTETVEAAIKNALMFWNQRRDEIIIQLKRIKNKIEHISNIETNCSRPDPSAPLKYEFLPVDFHNETETKLKQKNIDDLIQILQRAQPKFIAIDGSFHGKTAGSITASSNPEHNSMYSTSAIQTQFISRDSNSEEIECLFDESNLIKFEDISFSSIAGFMIEVIQGESGIFKLEESFVLAIRAETKKHRVPLIADEIQTGLFRCGKFLASYLYGINPDYILLGKALGGGLVKIGALLVEKSFYVHEFSRTHSSTFSDDDWSSHIALKTLEEVTRLRSEIVAKSEEFETAVRERISLINIKYPNVIRDFRGKGLLLGIEIDYTINNAGPVILEAFHQSGYMSYIFASYLLHNFGLRLGVTLSHANTLRLEPPACISMNSIRQLLNGLDDLCRKIYHGQIFALTEHLWTNTKHPNGMSVISKDLRKNVLRTANIPKLAFLTHLINENHLRRFDPVFENMSAKDCQRFIYEYGPHIKMLNYHEQIIEGLNGEKVHLTLYGSVLPSAFFEASLRMRDLKSLKIVQDIINQIHGSGSQLVGLGQYTSIVTENGTLLNSNQLGLTTGNSLTAAYALEGIRKILTTRNQHLREMKIAVVGAAGNICNVMAQIIADEAAEVFLFHREDYKESIKFQQAAQKILANSNIQPNKLTLGTDLGQLRECDIVLIGTNSSKTLIFPEHLKANAIVLDISVPTNIDKTVFTDRTDVECFIGGMAKLPFHQAIDLKTFPTPKGETFACMAETITLGLHRRTGNFSYGQIKKAQITEIMDLARLAGFSLGSLKRTPSL
jgi:acetylornithine/succinyldiaminopimelate/putrescine aminotransferase/predicted amino acid dehydrogenase